MNKIGFFRNKDSIYFVIIIFLFIAGYAFFFTSRLWMPPGSDVRYLTNLNEDVNWGNRTIQIIRWDYCDESKTMEVELDVENSEFDGKNSYDFEALEYGGKELKIKKIVEEADWIVIQISELPKRWSEVSLRMFVAGTDSDKLKLYTNIKAVNKVEQVVEKDINGYRVGRLEAEILNYQNEVADKNKEISELTAEIENIQAEISRLEESKTYQTEIQIEATNEKISDANTKLISNQEKIMDLQEEIEEINKRIEMVQLQINEVLGSD